MNVVSESPSKARRVKYIEFGHTAKKLICQEHYTDSTHAATWILQCTSSWKVSTTSICCFPFFPFFLFQHPVTSFYKKNSCSLFFHSQKLKPNVFSSILAASFCSSLAFHFLALCGKKLNASINKTHHPCPSSS